MCKLFFDGYPEDLMEKELVVPDNTVGLSEYIKVVYPSKVVVVRDAILKLMVGIK